MTGLPNRIHFHELVKLALLDSKSKNKSVAVLLLDLDRFKDINDTFGHHRGDFLIQKVGFRLKEALRPSDVVARLGGDEFGILLPLSSADDAAFVARKIAKTLEKPIELDGLPIAVETSTGVALFPRDGEDPDTLIRRADVAMYHAKKF